MSVDYDKFAKQYDSFRRPDKRIADSITKHLVGAQRIINVGAGTGAYEPTDCDVVAIEPSHEMIAKRKQGTTTAIQGYAEDLPFDDDEFDVAMGILTIHHWRDIPQGLSEMRRVAKRKVVILTWIDDSPKYWLEDYFPEMRVMDKALFPTLNELDQLLGRISSEVVEIPGDCTDGFMCAYWKRPDAYLDEGVRAAISTFARMQNVEAGLAQLACDISSGKWHREHGNLLTKDSMDLGYRLVVCDKTNYKHMKFAPAALHTDKFEKNDIA
ncbi:MAG: class I SAM-dependent methyltransferase [Proteobacteria bacterium]|nr:class I SAM-dependent methyltransferase [Pseudomonadota bacterium]